MVIFDKKEDFLPQLMDGMNLLRKDHSLYDVCIKFEDREIMAHKCVLAPVSDYFKSLFLGPFKTDNHIVEVDFSTVALDAESIEAIIDFLYTGLIEISDDNLEAILKLATFLLIRQVQDLCITFMEQSCDIDTYMGYYLLSVDYMVPGAEEIVMKTIKSRFHDYFILKESTKTLSVYHLEKLVEEYEIFENCSKVDILSYLSDWVLNGGTDKHETFACKVIEILRENEPKRTTGQGSDNCLKIDELQNENNEQQIQIVGDVSSEVEEPSRNPRKRFKITEAMEKMRHNLKKLASHSKFRLKCEEEIKRFLVLNAAEDAAEDTQMDKGIPGENAEDLSKESRKNEVEQVVIAIAPKHQSADFLQESQSTKGGEECKGDKNSFIVCVYKPVDRTWYYYEEWKDARTFHEIGSGRSKWPINFCTHDKLYSVSLEEKALYKYPLGHNQWDRYWSSASYKCLAMEIPDFDPMNDVRFCCGDGETVYLVLKESISERDDMSVHFNCYRLSDRESRMYETWDYQFSTPCIYNSEDNEVYCSRSFNVYVSPNNKQMIIAVEGEKLHTFVVNLENRNVQIQRHVMEDTTRRMDYTEMWYYQGNHFGKFMLLSEGNRLSLVDEILVNGDGSHDMYYRNVMIEKIGEMQVDDTDHDCIDTCLPTWHAFKSSPKLVESVNDGKSIWLFSSNGKFETSLQEARLGEDGLLYFHEHVPPPFASVSLMATGFVKSEHLVDLKPIVNFSHSSTYYCK